MIGLWVALAGGLGAAARFTLDGFLTQHNHRGLPIAKREVHRQALRKAARLRLCLMKSCCAAVASRDWASSWAIFSLAQVPARGMLNPARTLVLR